MMRVIDVIDIAAPIATVFDAAADVERWPAMLPHYRSVTIQERRPDGTTILRSPQPLLGYTEQKLGRLPTELRLTMTRLPVTGLYAMPRSRPASCR